MASKINKQPLGIFNQIGSMSWKNNGTSTLPLNREDEVKSYKLLFEITHTNGVNPVLSLPDFFRMITEVRITAGGRNNVKMVDALKMYVNYCKNYGILPKHSFDSTASTAGLTSWLIIEIPMCMFDMKRPHDSIFPAHRFTNLDMKVQFNTATAMGTDVTITSGTVTVYEDTIEDYNRLNANGVVDDYGFFKEVYQSKTLSSSNPKEPFNMSIDMDYKQFTFISTIDGVLSDAVINAVVVKSGGKVIRSIPAAVLKEHMRKTIGGQITDADLTGVLIVDFGERGHTTEFLNTIQSMGGFKQLTIELDVTATAGVDIVNQYSDFLELIPHQG